jgi:hypothetical protein
MRGHIILSVWAAGWTLAVRESALVVGTKLSPQYRFSPWAYPWMWEIFGRSTNQPSADSRTGGHSRTAALHDVESASDQVSDVGRYFKEAITDRRKPGSVLKFLEQRIRAAPFAMLGLVFRPSDLSVEGGRDDAVNAHIGGLVHAILRNQSGASPQDHPSVWRSSFRQLLCWPIFGCGASAGYLAPLRPHPGETGTSTNAQ